MTTGNLMIVQGGGPTAVFNASLSSAVAEAISQKKVGRILGARFGAAGLMRGDVIELGGMGDAELQAMGNSPGAALGSSRYQPTLEELERMVSGLRRLDVHYLIFIGGNGTMRGAELVSSMCRDAGCAMQVIGVPKTVDNDLAQTDRCPGYGSAARYVAQSTRDLGMDIRSLPQPVTILETMGRSVGWLAAASTLAKVQEEDAPHLVYLPEVPFYQERFLAQLDGVVSRQGWAVVVVSEGIRNEDGALLYAMSDASQMDPLQRPMTGGVGQFLAAVVGKSLKIRCRSEKPGLLGRASMVHVSAQDRTDAAAAGRAGVRALIAGETDQMVALRPLEPGLDPVCDLVPLSSVAGVERPLPAEWLSGGPLAVHKTFRDYLVPLVGELDHYSAAADLAHGVSRIC
jgi:6-phosphofructokinase 1